MYDSLPFSVNVTYSEGTLTAGLLAQLQAVSSVLRDDLKLSGNTTAYYESQNSFINQVLKRRLGIPIALAAIFMAITRRIGIHIIGLNTPGHFLLMASLPNDTSNLVYYIDSFHHK
jgi:regulator of sirC expression with transglutaminase-like and TPR domain